MKKVINLHVSTKNYMNCVDALIISVAQWLGIDYRMMFMEAWDFEYSEDKSTPISQRLSEGRSKTFKNLEKFHGLSVIKDSIFSQNLSTGVANEIKEHNLPVLLKIDCFWANWMPEFYNLKHYTSHFILILGFDSDKKMFFIEDAQNAKKGLWCTYREIESAMVYGCRFEITAPATSLDLSETLRPILQQAYPMYFSHNELRSIPEKIQALANDIKISFDPSIEIGEKRINPAEIKIVNTINNIAQSRLKFSLALDCLQEKTGRVDLTKAIHQLVELNSEWRKAFAVFVKYCFLKDTDGIRNHVASQLMKISTQEHKVIEMLIKSYEGYQVEEIQRPIFECNVYDLICNQNIITHPINLYPFFNNNGCYSSISNNTTAELSAPDRYLYIKNPNLVWFENANLLENRNDNFVCAGQIIDIYYELSSKSYLAFLICSEYASCCIPITLLFNDGSFETMKVGATSWLYPEPEYENYIAISGKPVQKTLDKSRNTITYNFPGHIFGSINRIGKKDAILEKIIFSDCINVHIFGISILEIP